MSPLHTHSLAHILLHSCVVATKVAGPGGAGGLVRRHAAPASAARAPAADAATLLLPLLLLLGLGASPAVQAVEC